MDASDARGNLRFVPKVELANGLLMRLLVDQ
jgi:hypothetical protein